MKIVQSNDNRLSIVPETDFEAEHLGKFFLGNQDRAVVVKSGMSIGDIMSVDIVVTNEKCPITIPDKEVKMCGCSDESNPKPCSCATEEIHLAPNSLKNLVKHG